MKLFSKDLYRAMAIGFLIGTAGVGLSFVSAQAQAAAPMHASSAR